MRVQIRQMNGEWFLTHDGKPAGTSLMLDVAPISLPLTDGETLKMDAPQTKLLGFLGLATFDRGTFTLTEGEFDL